MTPTVAAMVKKYIEFRDLLKARSDARAEEDKPYVEGMQVIEGMVALALKDQGVDSMKTEWGTAYKSTTMTCRVVDRDALMDYVREADAFNLLTAAVAKDAVREHMDEHQNQTPPGVDIVYFTKVNFRRS
jgi:hypothetical protein